MSKSLKNAARKRKVRGATTVEMAIVFPLIVLFFTFMFEVGRVLMLQPTADTAAYEAARAAMVPGATVTEAQQSAQQLVDAAGLTHVTITVTPNNLVESTPLVTVKVDIPVNDNSWIAPSQFADFVVSSEVTLLCERPPIVQLEAMTALTAKKNKLKGISAI
jgi:Flp pilus assembly protein TadG